MGYKSFLSLMASVSFVAYALLIYVVINVNPDEAGLMGLTAFYIALYAALVGLLSFAGIVFRVHVRGRKETAYREVSIAFRHALLLAGVGVSSLILSSAGYLVWWNFLLILGIVGILEYVFLTIQESHRG